MRISDFDVLIVPRLGGCLMRATGRAAGAPSFPPPASSRRAISAPAQREAWTDAIANSARAAKRPVLFVGHGLGAAAIASAAFALGGADVRGAFLVSPTDRAGLERVAGQGWSLPGAPLPWPTVVVASRNAADSAYDAVATLAAEWGADLIDAGHAGGLDADSGHGPWPEGLMRLAGFIKKLA